LQNNHFYDADAGGETFLLHLSALLTKVNYFLSSFSQYFKSTWFSPNNALPNNILFSRYFQPCAHIEINFNETDKFSKIIFVPW